MGGATPSAIRSTSSLATAVLVLAGRAALAQPTAAPSAAPDGQVLVTPPPPAGPVSTEAPPPPPAVEPPPRAPPPEKMPVAGYIPSTAFVIQSDDAAYRLRVGLQAGYKFEPVYQDGAYQNRNTFFVLRPILSGTFFKEWIHFWTSFEFASNPPYLLDSYVEIQPLEELGYPAHSQHLVLKARYAYGHQNSPGMTALGAVPLVISTPGATQLATVQGNIAF
jgi:hypothetical protein